MPSEQQVTEGPCACGGVTVSVTGPFAGPYQCICSQCQHAAGGNGAVFVIAGRDQVTVAGEVRSYAEPRLSGHAASRTFCPTCGTAIFSEQGSSPGRLAVEASMFAPATLTGPIQAVFWTDEAPAWAPMPPTAKMFVRQP